MSIESLITQTRQKFKNITPQVQIGMSKVSLITEAEIDAIKLNWIINMILIQITSIQERELLLFPDVF